MKNNTYKDKNEDMSKTLRQYILDQSFIWNGEIN